MVTKLSSLLLATFLLLTPFGASRAETEILSPPEEKFQTQNTYYYNFGYWPVGATAYRDFYFRSYQRGLRIYSIYTRGFSFRSYHNCPSRLYQRQGCRIRVYFTPRYRGHQSGQTVINTSGGRTWIRLSGYGH